MGDLTKNLSRKEFKCRCGCGWDTVDFELPLTIQAAADYFVEVYQADKAIVEITSGNRCLAHNEATPGAAPKSQHLFARAADHKIYLDFGRERILVDTDELADYYHEQNPNRFGIGRYPNGRVHLDTRGERFRWDYRK